MECAICKKWFSSSDCTQKLCSACQRKKDVAKTHADRIRAMSDEELAAFMRDMMDCVSCRQVMSRHNITCTGNYNECVSKCKEWLLKPAEEE